MSGPRPAERTHRAPAHGADLRCEGLTVRADGHRLLADVDLEVSAGSLVTVLGPSGAGKTTLLRAVAGLTPAAGRVALDGCDLARVPPHRRPVGMVFQDPRLFPGLNVAENVAFALRLGGQGRRERRRRAASLLAEVGLDGLGDRRVADLSGGEQQRVALARALAAEPRLLLLDEPLSAVDAERRGELRELIRTTQRARGLMMLYVTHDRAEAAALGDVVAVVLDGRLAQLGPPARVFERPATAGVARVVGVTNLLPVHIRGGEAAINGTRVAVGGHDGPATLAIRPERVRLEPDGRLRLRVTHVAYLGTHQQVRLSGHGLALEAQLPLGPTPSPGSEVGVELPVEHLWRLPEEEEVADGGQ